MHLRKGKLVFYSALFTIAVAVLSSCLKSVESTPPKPMTFVSVLHLAPGAPDADVYLNNTKSTNAPIPSGSFFSKYSALDPNVYTIVFKKGGSDSVIASLPADIYDSLTYSTLLLYNNPFGPGVNAIRIQDNFSQLSGTYTNFRFFHMAPGLMPVDLYFGNDLIASTRQYADNTLGGQYNQFTTRDPGSYLVTIKKAGSDSTITQTTANLNMGGAYTILLSGVPGGTGAHEIAIDVLQAQN